MYAAIQTNVIAETRKIEEINQSTLPCAAAAIARVEREMDVLWRHALSAERREVSERLVQVSHLLRRALRLLDGPAEIG